MKWHWIIFVWITATVAAQAQPPSERPSRRAHQDWRARGERSEAARPASLVQQWLIELEAQNPAEFDRLQALRRENPSAFRREAGIHLQDKLMERIREDRPNIHAAMTQLPEDDRVWLAERFLQIGFSPRHRPTGDGGPERPEDMDRIRRLVRQYRQTDSPEKQQNLRNELEQQLGEHYDRRLEERRRQFKAAEDKLEAMRLTLERGEIEKRGFIEEKLSTWLIRHED